MPKKKQGLYKRHHNPRNQTQTLRCSQGNYCRSRRLLSSHNILLQVNVLLLQINNINGAEGKPTRQQEASLLKTVIKYRRVNCSLYCSCELHSNRLKGPVLCWRQRKQLFWEAIFSDCRTFRETIVLQETPTMLSPVRESCLTPTSFGRNIRFMG